MTNLGDINFDTNGGFLWQKNSKPCT